MTHQMPAMQRVKIEANRVSYRPYWVHAERFEELWRRNPQTHLFVSAWRCEPDKSWFRHEWSRNSLGTKAIAFQTADIYLEPRESIVTIGFTNGRHRTRWLLQSEADQIPVGIEEDDIPKAVEIGLAVRQVEKTDELVIAERTLYRRA
jgi:hypothetical protein